MKLKPLPRVSAYELWCANPHNVFRQNRAVFLTKTVFGFIGAVMALTIAIVVYFVKPTYDVAMDRVRQTTTQQVTAELTDKFNQSLIPKIQSDKKLVNAVCYDWWFGGVKQRSIPHEQEKNDRRTGTRNHP